ncbi:MAG: nucleotide exchange factor GrpE [Thermoproteota archaeon]|nr:nucleotide exchange factor GrpE [Thermoproteota archaeon]
MEVNLEAEENMEFKDDVNKDEKNEQDILGEDGSRTAENEDSKKISSRNAHESEAEILRDEISRLKETSEKNLTKLRYLLADYDNYRKQIEKQMQGKVESAKAELILKIINIYDDYLRAVDTLQNNSCPPGIRDGLNGILKNLEALLKSEGVAEIEAIGTPFDANVHDAVGFAPSEDHAENTVIDVVRKGFMLNNKVLRPSLVILSKKIISNKDTEQPKME